MFAGEFPNPPKRLLGWAIAGLLLAVAPPSAAAADLGGDCCLDLEERIGELEATAARKGNRKVSVQISGHINRMLLFWDDGINHDVYSVDNSDNESRFKLSGSAHVTPSISAGFTIEVELLSAISFSVNDRVDGAPNENRDGDTNVHTASFHLNHKQLGKLTVGRAAPSTDDILTLDLSSNPIGGPDPGWTDSFVLVRPHGTLGCNGAACRTSLTTDAVSPERDTPNADIVRYDSPTIHGFILSTSFGEDDLVDATLRYKATWETIRFVAGVGYLWITDETESRSNPGDTLLINCPEPGLGQRTCVDERRDLETFAGSTSIMHMPTGLYANFAAVRVSFNSDNGKSPRRAAIFTAPVTGRGAEDATFWYVQAGIKRRFLVPRLGATTLYGEYQEWDDFGVRRDASSVTGLPVGVSEITDTSVNMWGVGVVQDIDAAALKLYGGLRVWEHDMRAAVAATAPAGEDIPLQDFYALGVGGKLNF